MSEDRSVIEVALLHDMHFEAHGEDGRAISLDASSSFGGQGLGFRPLELILAGLAGCTGMDVISILRKKRQQVTDYRVEVWGTQETDYPHAYTDISLRHIVTGEAVSEDAVKRAIQLSEDKYCPAYAMLSKAATITSTFEVHPAGPAD
jgi:putative redox protein